jgi:hypothetical protein
MAPHRAWRFFKFSTKNLLIAGAVALAVMIAPAIYFLFAIGLFDRPTKDAAMIRTFTDHRRTFDRLVAVAQADPLLGDSLYDLTSPAGLRAYRAAVDSLHFLAVEPRGSGRSPPFYLVVSWWGFAGVAVGSKCYVFSRTPLGPLAPSLDNPEALSLSDSGYVYRYIAPNWYLSFDQR